MCTKHQACCAHHQVPSEPSRGSQHSHSCCCDDHHHSQTHTASEQGCGGSEQASACSSGEPNGDDEDPATRTLTQTWKIVGMDCPSCARKVETAVSKVDGVVSTQVLFATEKLVVKTHQANLDSQIEDAIISSGFGFSSPLSSAQSEHSSPLWRQRVGQYRYILTLGVAMLIGAATQSSLPLLSHWVFILTCLIGLYPVAKKAFKLMMSGTPFAIESLMTVAALGALYLGETAEAGMVLLLFLIGEELEGFASAKARSGVQALMALVPQTAIQIVQGQRVEVEVNVLMPNDVIEVSPGDRLPVDGYLLDEFASVDESALTGESVPVDKRQSDTLMAGVVVVDRVVQICVTSKPGENAIDRILHMIEEAELRKAPIERFLDKFSRWYTPLMMLVACMVVIVPPLLFGQSWDTWIYRGLATLLIACPCALVISTPAAITSGLATASRHGALIKGGAALEQLGKIQRIAFDKTGTLTQGTPQVTDVVNFSHTDFSRVLGLACALEQGSKHPLAKSLVNYAQQNGALSLYASDKQTLVGRGVKGVIDGGIYQLISVSKLSLPLNDEQQQSVRHWQDQAKTVAVLIDQDENILAAIAWQDTLREDAQSALEALKRLDIQAIMLTGDNVGSAKALSEVLGLTYQANLMPEDKVNYIKSLSEHGHVAMVGDGINDAPAMKAANLGIAMGSGSDVALETADAALTHNRLIELANVIELSRATSANIRQNVSLALGLKAIFLVTSLLGVTGLWLAVLADSGATALVTANALRLLRFKGRYTKG